MQGAALLWAQLWHRLIEGRVGSCKCAALACLPACPPFPSKRILCGRRGTDRQSLCTNGASVFAPMVPQSLHQSFTNGASVFAPMVPLSLHQSFTNGAPGISLHQWCPSFAWHRCQKGHCARKRGRGPSATSSKFSLATPRRRKVCAAARPSHSRVHVAAHPIMLSCTLCALHLHAPQNDLPPLLRLVAEQGQGAVQCASHAACVCAVKGVPIALLLQGKATRTRLQACTQLLRGAHVVLG